MMFQGQADPEPYLMGASLLGMNPAECLVHRDAPAGIRAAHAGAMKAIGLTSTYPAAALQEADAVRAEINADQSRQIERRPSLRVSVEKPSFQRSHSSSSMPRSVFSSRYFTMTGV